MGFPGHECRRWLAVTGLLGVHLASTFAHATGTRPEETIPDSDGQLSLTELRWCTLESIRVETEDRRVDSVEQWEVDYYNANVDFYNERCTNKTYYQDDQEIIDRELAAGGRQRAEQEGIARLAKARFQREARRVYVDGELAAIQSEPGETGVELGRVPRWGELLTTGRTQSQWYEVEWAPPSLDRAILYGWVFGGLIQKGSGENARFNYCETNAEGRAEHNEVVRGRLNPANPDYLKVWNGTDADAYVKLVSGSGTVVVSFLVAAGRTANLTGIPSGSYQVWFATGALFSRGCDSFSRRGFASQFGQRIDYGPASDGWEITLHAVTDGNVRTQSMSYDDFDKL